MRPLMATLCALGLWASTVVPASAGWDNVFQATCFFHRQPTTSGYYAPPVVAYSSPVVAYSSPVVVAQSAPCDSCAPPPQPTCTTNYVQRCYYQPTTTYQTTTYYESVTTYRTSYYYEPVVSYRYSTYYDPCTSCAQQVAVPTTSYQLRAQNCPVQSWVARCAQVPVTTQQKVCYWQPQTTCCQTTSGQPIMQSAAVIPSPAPALPAPAVPAPASPPPEIRQIPDVPAPPKVDANRIPNTSATKPNLMEQYYPPLPKTPDSRDAKPGTYWQPQLGAPVPVQSNVPPPPQPPVKLERIAIGPNSQVDGQVLRSDNSPKPNAKVLFINASTGKRETIYANTAGRFHVELPGGSWHVYLYGSDDIPIHHSRIDVNGAQFRQVSLVSRGN